MERKLINVMTVVLAVVMPLSILTSCNRNEENIPSVATTISAQKLTEAALVKEKPVKIHYGAYPGQAMPSKDSPVVKKVEELFNCEFEFWFNDLFKYEFVQQFRANGGDEVYAEIREQYAAMSRR